MERIAAEINEDMIKGAYESLNRQAELCLDNREEIFWRRNFKSGSDLILSHKALTVSPKMSPG